MAFEGGESCSLHQNKLNLDLIWTCCEPHGSAEGAPWELRGAVVWKDAPGCCSPWRGLSLLLWLFSASGWLCACLKQSSKRWKTQCWPRLKKSTSSASFAVLILVNYRAAICNLSGRWIQLNWKRANLKVKVFYFLCEIKGPVEFPALQIHLSLKACCAP